MTHFAIFSSLWSVGLLLIAGTASNASASEVVAGASEFDGPHSAQSLFAVLPGNTSDDLLLVQGRRSGGGSMGGSRGMIGGSPAIGGGFSGPRQAFHRGPSFGGPHPRPYPHHPHHRPWYYRYPYYYGSPYSSYYAPSYSVPTYIEPTPPVVTEPAPTFTPNLLPATANIQVVNPPDNRIALSFTLNGQTMTLQPGQTRDLQSDRSWVIEFDRGGQFGLARYSLQPGAYVFTPSDRGWELYHQTPPAIQGGQLPTGATPFSGGTSSQFPLPGSDFPSSLPNQ